MKLGLNNFIDTCYCSGEFRNPHEAAQAYYEMLFIVNSPILNRDRGMGLEFLTKQLIRSPNRDDRVVGRAYNLSMKCHSGGAREWLIKTLLDNLKGTYSLRWRIPESRVAAQAYYEKHFIVRSSRLNRDRGLGFGVFD